MAFTVIAGYPSKEVPPETPDGIITDFTTTVPYKPGTISVWINGQRKLASLDDGFTEAPPTTVSMKIPLLTDDTVMLEFEAA